MKKHERLKEWALEMINELHADKSVSLEKTLHSLNDICGEIETLIELVEGDIKRREKPPRDPGDSKEGK